VTGIAPPDVELWVKREDESGGALYGGNKVRKLEFLLGRARAEHRRRLVTWGQYASHHVAATAIHGVRAGFEVEALLFPQPVDAYVRQMLRVDLAAGANVRLVRSVLGVVPTWARTRRERDACWLAAGGSCAIGTLGTASLGFEIAAQVGEGVMPQPDVVYCALGSAGTVAGLLYGLRCERAVEIVAVNAADRLGVQVHKVASLVRELDAMLDPLLPPDVLRAPRARLRVERRFVGSLSRPTPASIAATETARARLHLEPVYTGKAMAALLDDAREGRLAGKRVLFLHTWNGTELAPLIERAPAIDMLPAALRRVLDTQTSPRRGEVCA
jgi:1-aminocyclopropane-1-carboxylate deaminase/D-cysteine desulfhydrase-like pyridoxal-dependent ACC family enzyme